MMNWTRGYTLFLFDFDGLLVNTEPLHWKAYARLLERYGIAPFWDFEEYCRIAHNAKTPLIDIICSMFPLGEATKRAKEVLYQEKTEIFLQIVQKEPVDYLPGVEELLLHLDQQGMRRAVVTHSSKALVHAVRQRNPLLNTIPHWVTREDYGPAKPDPHCYLYAIRQFGQKDDRIIGFEDSPRGLIALSQAPVTPVLVQLKESRALENFSLSQPYYHFSSFKEIPQQALPPLVKTKEEEFFTTEPTER